jgi:hypothetical protein
VTQPDESLEPGLPRERVGRGVGFALIAAPVGIGLWLLLWSAGFIVSVFALGIALGALYLYRFGSGGRIGTVGAITVTAITAGSIAISMLVASAIYADVSLPPQPAEVAVAIGLAVIFGGLGSFIAWRTAAVQANETRQQERRPLPGFEDGSGKDTW